MFSLNRNEGGMLDFCWSKRNARRATRQGERWVESGLLVAEKQFRRITGHKQIPALITELEAMTPARTTVVKRRKAS